MLHMQLYFVLIEHDQVSQPPTSIAFLTCAAEYAYTPSSGLSNEKVRIQTSRTFNNESSDHVEHI